MMADGEAPQIVAAVMRRDGDVLLVRRQGPDGAEPVWALPGGIVGVGELLTEALAREVREATGLEIGEPARLAYIAQLHNPSAHSGSRGELPTPVNRATAFVFEVAHPGGEISAADPDDVVSEARFWPLGDAIDELGRHAWRFMREPVVAYLRGDAPAGTMWLYRRRSDGRDDLTTRLQPEPGRPESETDWPARRSPATAGNQGDPAALLDARRQHAIVLLGCLGLLVVLVLVIVAGIIFVHK